MKGLFSWLIALVVGLVRRHPVAAPIALAALPPVAVTAAVDPALLSAAVEAVLRLVLALFGLL